MKRYVAVCLTMILLYACKDDDNGYHLPPKEMGKLLMDLHIAEAYSTLVKKDSLHQQSAKNYDSLSVYYKDVFTHYHITQAQFDATMSWYREHPDDLDTVYTNMLPAMGILETTSKLKR
jgi:hypothetical protein